MAHLHIIAGQPQPPEYQEMLLCRIFGWLPSQLDQEDAERIDEFLAMLSGEYEINKLRSYMSNVPGRRR